MVFHGRHDGFTEVDEVGDDEVGVREHRAAVFAQHLPGAGLGVLDELVVRLLLTQHVQVRRAVRLLPRRRGRCCAAHGADARSGSASARDHPRATRDGYQLFTAGPRLTGYS